jgi:hypothetical protein
MEVLVPSVPKRLRVTETMVCDFLVDPVMGVKVIFGAELDVFQQVRLRAYWWVPDVIDSSGFSTAKTLCFWLFLNLRCIIIPDQVCGAYYYTFETGKQTFWSYYRSGFARTPIFQAQLGKLDEMGDEAKSLVKGPACFVASFKNGSEIKMPAPSWTQDARSQASLRFNVVGIDEWTKVEASGSTGIDDQILGRVTRPCWNQHHPLWGNHTVFLATAEPMSHVAYRRYQAFQRRISRGDPSCACLSFSFKDYSNKRCQTGKTFREEFRMEQKLESMKAQFTRQHYLCEVLGVWSRSGRGWYSDEALARCVERGRQLNTEACCTAEASDEGGQAGRKWHYFMGVDPAPAVGVRSDDGVICVMRARLRAGGGAQGPERGEGEFSPNPGDWQCEYVYAFRCRAMSPRQWSGKIHLVHQRFGLSGICMDPNGGGNMIALELNKGRQLINDIETECVPIATPSEALAQAHFILSLFKRGDNGVESLWPHLAGDDNLVDAQHVVMQEAVEHAQVAFPVPWDERSGEGRRRLEREWEAERVWALKMLSIGVHQLVTVQAAVKEDGTWLLTRRGARQFFASGKKDVAYAMIYAYVRFLIWLRYGESELELRGPDAAMFFGFAEGVA